MSTMKKEKTLIINASMNYIMNSLNKKIILFSSKEFIIDCNDIEKT